jgi:hypothetical protein
MRPAHTHGSGHRVDLAARPCQPARRPLIRQAQWHLPKARCGRCTLSWSANSANTNRSCRPPKMSIRSSTSRRTVPTHRSASAFARGAPHRRAQHLDPLSGNDRIERAGELGSTIPQHKPEPTDTLLKAHHQIPGLLGHPLPHRMRPHPEHLDPAGRYLDRDQHLQPPQHDRIHGDKVQGQHAGGLSSYELPPGQRRPGECRSNPARCRMAHTVQAPILYPRRTTRRGCGDTPRQQCKPAHHLAEQQIQQTQGHASIIMARWLPWRTRSSAPTTEYWHPQARDF